MRDITFKLFFVLVLLGCSSEKNHEFENGDDIETNIVLNQDPIEPTKAYLNNLQYEGGQTKIFKIYKSGVTGSCIYKNVQCTFNFPMGVEDISGTYNLSATDPQIISLTVNYLNGDGCMGFAYPGILFSAGLVTVNNLDNNKYTFNFDSVYGHIPATIYPPNGHDYFLNGQFSGTFEERAN